MSDPIRWSPIMTPSPGGAFVCNHDYAMLEKERDDLRARVAELEAERDALSAQLRAAREQEQEPVADGFVMVPVEPTEEMFVVGGESYFDCAKHVGITGSTEQDQNAAASIYRAMLAVSQQAAKRPELADCKWTPETTDACPYCAGEACRLCGPDPLVPCEHDCVDRHQREASQQAAKPAPVPEENVMVWLAGDPEAGPAQ